MHNSAIVHRSLFIVHLSFIRLGGLCNWTLQTPPGPEGSNGSRSFNVTQYPPCLAPFPKDEISGNRSKVPAANLHGRRRAKAYRPDPAECDSTEPHRPCLSLLGATR